MKNVSNSIVSPRKKCAMQFATWLVNLPELEDWEERRYLVKDLEDVEARLEQMAIYPRTGLPDLREMRGNTAKVLAEWTEAVMERLDLDPPEDWESTESTSLEKVMDLVELLTSILIPGDQDR